MSELRVLRDRIEATLDALDVARADAHPHGSAAAFGVTTTVTTYPTASPAWFAIEPRGINGDETEGTAASYAGLPATGTFFAYNVGKKVPPEGTPVVCHAAGSRWVFRYDLAPT